MAWCIYKVHPTEDECLTIADTEEQAIKIGQEWITPGENFFIATVIFNKVRQFAYQCIAVTNDPSTAP